MLGGTDKTAIKNTFADRVTGIRADVKERRRHELDALHKQLTAVLSKQSRALDKVGGNLSGGRSMLVMRCAVHGWVDMARDDWTNRELRP